MINSSDIEALQYWNEQTNDHSYMDSFQNFDAYQDFTDSTAIYPDDKALEYVALGLASEAGEFAGKIKKFIRDGTYDTNDIASELGDVVWYCARAAEEMGLLFSDVVRMNVDKLEDRLARGVLKGSGDKR